MNYIYPHFKLCIIIGASVSELPLVDSTDALSCTIYTAGTRYCACAALRANVAGGAGLGIESVQLSQHFQPASDRDRGALSRHLQGS